LLLLLTVTEATTS